MSSRSSHSFNDESSDFTHLNISSHNIYEAYLLENPYSQAEINNIFSERSCDISSGDRRTISKLLDETYTSDKMW